MCRTERNSRIRRGFTLIEVLIASLVMTLLGLGVWTLLRSSYDSQYEIVGQNGANTNARQAVDELADHLRGANQLTAGDQRSLTFTDNSSNVIKYWRSTGNSVLKTVNGLPTGGAVVSQNITSMTFVYWTNTNGTWSSTTAPSTPSSVGAIDFTVASKVNNSSRQISGSVRLRQK